MTATDRPDPGRLGGLAWTRRTGGRLTRRERARLLAAIGRGQWENVLGRTKLALGWLPPGAANVDLDTFAVPDSRFARQAEDACAELPPGLIGHSYRTWLFGNALAAVDRTEARPRVVLLRFFAARPWHRDADARPGFHRSQRREDIGRRRRRRCQPRAGRSVGRWDLRPHHAGHRDRARRFARRLHSMGRHGRRGRPSQLGHRAGGALRSLATPSARRIQKGATRDGALRGHRGTGWAV